ncbi:thioredoxin fold domain-containing protein [Chitinophaga filiformis]|uniref:TlpA family protein disulfide reductase n=1 Tax=Chitinophaga filiformis TaxID=104663 RepID=UPI001F34E897|nr:thioredoxin fold domain-containing protein [Chitinophaga filiformis]MCF6406623.1 thioredoxin fold domain-containing protein [Chitinophaga filiformis]
MRSLLLVLVLAGIASCTKYSRALPPGIDKDLPPFDIQLLDTTVKLNTAKIPKGKPVVLFFFGPDCPYCQSLTREITKRMDELKDVRFYMATMADFKEIQMYDTLFKLDKYKNVTIGKDMKGFFFTYYKAPGFPYLVIYDKKKEFKQIVIGGVSVDSLKKVINS